MKSEKKVCIVSPFPPPFGGMAVQAEKLSLLLEQEGYGIVRVPTNTEFSGVAGMAATIPGLRTVLRQVIFLVRLNKTLGGVEAVYFLTGFLNFFLWVTYPALILILLRRKRVVLSARGGDARAFFRKHRSLVRLILKRLPAITVPSGFLKEAFKEELGIDTVIVPNIADLKQFTFARRLEFRPRMIVTRSLEEIYDVATVIRAFNLVKKEFPYAELGIVGKGRLRSSLESLVKDLGIEDSVTFYGEVNHSNIAQIYNHYDIFINASRVDNLPGSVLEAFAGGLPVVSTNAGGIPYMVVNGENGLLSEVGDHETLSANALRILKTPALGEALAMKGYVELQKYTWPHIRSILLPLLTDER